MTREELAQDLSYVRAMAEEGRHAPLLGGSFLLFWGLLNTTAYLLHWSLLKDLIPGHEGPGFAVLWMSYGILAGIGSGVLGARVRDKPGKSAIGVRAESAIWRGAGIALGLVALGSIARMVLTDDPLAVNAIMGPAFGFFGAALTATAMMSGQKWLWTFSFLSFATCAALCAFANEPWAYLLAAGASTTVLALPGVILLRREPSPIV